MKRTTPLVALSLLAALALSVSDSRAQSRSAKPAKPSDKGEEQGYFGESVTVSVVNVDVYVTDKDGKRVTGLNKDDFEVFENGRPVQITNFYAVEGGNPIREEEPAPAPTAEPEPPGAPREPEKVEVPEEQKLRLVIYIDNFNLRPFNRNRVMRELRAFLGSKLKAGDQMMLVSYDRELHIRNTFTSDPSLIAASLLELEKVTAHAIHYDSDRRDILQRIEDSRSVLEAQSAVRSYAESIYNDLSFSIDALKKTVDLLAGLPGRKAILYVSDGLEMMAGQDMFYAVQDKYREQSSSLTEAFQFDTSRRFTELANQANANRITFYTIDAAGLRVYDSVSAAERGPGPQAAGLSTLIDSVRISNLQSPLQMIAEATGGMAVLNSNSVMPHLERIAADFGTYYSLGYTPPHYGDGRYYKIEVKVKKKGFNVRHREGYRDKSADSRMTDGTLAALSFPFSDNALGVTLEFGKPAARTDGFYLVPIVVKIPLSKVVLVPRGAQHDARLRLFIAAIDSSGNTSEVQQTPVPISVPEADVDKLDGKHYAYTVSLLMRPGEQRVAVGVRDDVAAQQAFVSAGLRVGAGSR